MKEHLEVLEKQSLEAEALQEWGKLAQLYNKARFGHQVREGQTIVFCDEWLDG